MRPPRVVVRTSASSHSSYSDAWVVTPRSSSRSHMPVSWSAEQLESIGRSGELQIATRRTDGTLRSWIPIWVVCVGDDVYVRTWYRRTTGWFGHVLHYPQARIRVASLETDVSVVDLGD